MDRPLEGVRVVELAMWVAGPATAAVLGDWGADVIKLEDPKTGDPIRGFVTRTMGDPNARIRPPFELDNRNKRSVAVDLRRAEGHAFALRLIERADVFVTSLRLDAIERMKLDYATMSAKNPRLIYASINGYGHRGPDRNRPAYDYAAAWARSGLMATIAEPGQPHISLFSMGLWMNASDLTVGLMTGRSPESESREQRVNPIWSSYRCADGRWIYFVMIQSDRHWPDFCAALGRPDWLSDPRFKDSVARGQNCGALTGEIDRVMASKRADEWAPVFDRNNLIWAPVRTDAEVLEDPQAEAIGAFAAVDHPQISGCRVVNSPVEFGDADPRAHRAAPELGQHTEEVALEAGLTWEEIARLKEAGVLG